MKNNESIAGGHLFTGILQGCSSNNETTGKGKSAIPVMLQMM